MNHSFDIKVATEYGVNEAILFNHICYWYKYNKANNQNYIDGEYWTYNSYKAFAEMFTYWSERQIRYIINNLIKNKLIKKGSFNKKNYDQTNWYTLDTVGKQFIQNYDVDVTKLSDQDVTNLSSIADKNVRPIPNINTNIKPNINNTVGAKAPQKVKFCPPTLEEVKAYIQEKGYKVDAEKWWNYYDSKDWYIGKNKMVKWKSAVATWNTRNYDEERKIKLEAQKAYIADVEMKKQKNKNNLEKTHEMFQKAEKFMEFLGGKSDKSRSRAIDNHNQSLLPDKKDTG